MPARKKKTSSKKAENISAKNERFVFLAGLLTNKIKLIPLFIISVFIFVFFLNYATGYSFSANFADNVLRPVIGNKNTVFLESSLFAVEDFFKQVVYKFKNPENQLFTETQKNLSGLNSSSGSLDLNPIVVSWEGFAPLSNEGVWQPISLDLFANSIVAAQTFVRPDPQRSFALVSLVQMDMSKLRLSAVAGTREPGGLNGQPGPGVIPADIKNSNMLVAAFNGGFQEKDGHYGMIVAGHTYLPLLKGLATLVVDSNAKLKIIDYQGQDLGAGNLIIRQNGAMLIADSVIIPSSSDNRYKLWGRTTTNTMYTWRSGIGITKSGNLIYAVGPSLVPETLARALLMAGAVDAMQLDINPYWVRFTVFRPLGAGNYRHYALLKNMFDGGEQFLHGYQKDFFYVFKR